MNFKERIKNIERIDQLIRLKATGTPMVLASKLKISEKSLYRLLNDMKKLDAPIVFCNHSQSYIYTVRVKFKFGFYISDLTVQESRNTFGGCKMLNYFHSHLLTVY